MIIISEEYQYELTSILDALDWNNEADDFPANPMKPIFLEYPIVKNHKQFLGFRRAVWVKPKTDADSGSELDETIYSQNEVFKIQEISPEYADSQAMLRFMYDSNYEFNEKGDYTKYTNIEPKDAANEQDDGKYWSKFEMVCGYRVIV